MSRGDIGFLFAGVICMGIGQFAPWLENGAAAFAFGLGLAVSPMYEFFRWAWPRRSG